MADSENTPLDPQPDGAADRFRDSLEATAESARAPEAPQPRNGNAGLDGIAAAEPGDAEHADGGAGEDPPRLTGLAAPRARAPRASWALAALLCVAAGSLAAALGARSIAHTNSTKAERAFQASAAGVASNVKLALQHEEDLASSASTFFAANPGASQSEFASWSHWVRALRRYPELERIGLVTVVRASDLAAFQTRVTGNAPASAVATPSKGATQAAKAKTVGAAAPAAAPTTVGLLRITPPGARSYYCLATAEVVRGPATRARAGLDYCARIPALIASRASGAALYAPVSANRSGQLAIETPVYRGAAPPTTAAGREAAFAGWLREVLTPGSILEAATGGRLSAAAALSYHHGASHVSFALGAPRAGAPSRTTRIHGGWVLQSFGSPISTGVFADREAGGLLIGGTLLSLLLGLLIYLLGSSRTTPRAPRRAALRRGESLYDELTGLAGRELTLDRAERTVARAGRQPGMLAGALLVDLDWFADVNEKLGSPAGDQLLKIVADRLHDVIRTDDSVGRLGGDQFLITVESVARGVRLDSLARRVIEALHEPVAGLDDFGPSFYPTASIGVAYGRYTDHELLIHDAELAMRASKEAGKDRYTLFNANMRAVIENRGVLEAELNAALREGHLFLVYQPICDLRTRKVVSLEAHIRWRHPKQGILLPADFLPLAEETGLIVPIGRWALQEACGRAAMWEVAGQSVGVSVQISANQFNRDGFATDVLRALQQSGVSPAQLTLEVTESIVMADAQTATERLQTLKGLGVRIAIDDFGSGYAYRSDLEKMPLDFLKVDRTSLAASEDESYRHWLLEAILVFGRDLKLNVIAKGIETGDQVAALQEMGATLAQGHFFGEPLPAEALERLLEGGVPSVRATSTGTFD